MPRNGSGVYNKPAGTTFVPNTTIESSKVNSLVDDIVDDLNAARPVTAGGTGQTSVPAARQAFTTYTTKSAGYTAAKTDAGAIHRCSAEITVSLTAATTLGANWTLTIIADGGSVTIDANGTELINGAETLVVADGDATYLICTGSAFVAIAIPGVAGVAKLDTVNTFTKTQVWSKGADVASAAALTLGDDGNYFDVTGTTAITSIATVGVGTVIKLHFDGSLTLTHHSTDLVLPGAANITTAAGDEAEFVEYAAGDWRCTNYQRANGAAILGNVLALQNGGTIALSGTSIDLTGIPAGVQRVTLEVSMGTTNGASRLELGDASGYPSSGYSGAISAVGAASVSSVATNAAYIGTIGVATSPAQFVGRYEMSRQNGNVWLVEGVMQYLTNGNQIVNVNVSGLTGPLSRLRLSSGSAATLDGTAQITWEF